MPFPRAEVEQLLVRCHRRCCICHRFCGVKIETDHVIPVADGGDDTIDNAIPVCFECHAEIHGYNDQHPRGRKFRPGELREHKRQWLEICRSSPAALLNASSPGDVGPLQALLDELSFNAAVARRAEPETIGAAFYDDQFRRAIEQGSIAILKDEIRDVLLEAYVAIRRANTYLQALTGSQEGLRSYSGSSPTSRAAAAVTDAVAKIENAQDALLRFLRHEAPGD